MKKLFFSTLLVGALLASCSGDEPAGNTDNENGGESGFLALNICTPSSNAGRATDGGFEDGTAAENAAENGMFFLFDASGEQSQNPQTINLEWKPSSPDAANTAPNREKISEALLVIDKAQSKPDPAELLVILNCPYTVGQVFPQLSNKSLEELTKADVLALINDCASTEKFIMTNSVYEDNCAAQIEHRVMPTVDAAKANAMDVYVERVVAKVRTAGNAGAIPGAAGYTENGATPEAVNIGDIDGDGTENTLKIHITGMTIANKANMSWLFKHGFDAWSTFADAIDANNHRSYWATQPTTTDNAAFAYVNKSYNEAIDGFEANAIFSDYVQENTIQSTADVDNSSKQTCILVTAQLMKNDNTDTPVTFVKWGGKYWAKDKFGANAANVIRGEYRVKTTDPSGATVYQTLPAEAFEWCQLKEENSKQVRPTQWQKDNYKVWENTMCIKADYAGEIVKKDTDGNWGTAATKEEVNSTLEQTLKVLMWNEGRAYYYVPIESFLQNGDLYRIGIVRNHIYDLTLNKISGVGVPVWNPDEEIIPERPEEELFYLSAQVHILRWKVASQTVNFE